jgi:hypothetical protein
VQGALTKLKCFERLCQLTNTYDDVIDFLEHDRLLSHAEHQALKASNERIKDLFRSIENRCADERITMAHFTWTILPNESITLTIITSSSQKTFRFGE